MSESISHSLQRKKIPSKGKKKIAGQEILIQSRPMGEILDFVKIFYSNAFIPHVPEDLSSQITLLEQALQTDTETPEIEALEQQIIERLAMDLEMTVGDANEMFSTVYEGY